MGDLSYDDFSRWKVPNYNNKVLYIYINKDNVFELLKDFHFMIWLFRQKYIPALLIFTNITYGKSWIQQFNQYYIN